MAASPHEAAFPRRGLQDSFSIISNSYYNLCYVESVEPDWPTALREGEVGPKNGHHYKNTYPRPSTSSATVLSCQGCTYEQIRVPMIIISDHDIEDGEQLAHTGSEGHLLGLASGTQTLVEGSNHRVEAGGYESGHEESGPYLSTAAPDGSLTPQGPAVSIEGSHSNQSCDLTAVEGPQLRQVGQEGGAKYRAPPPEYSAASRLWLSRGDWNR